MNEVQVFNFEQSNVRTVMVDSEPYFVGKDVAEVLGYSNTQKAIRDHVDVDDKLAERIVLSGQNREVVVINESGVYSLIFGSKLDSAKRFKKWVTSEVLPSIRKTGGYQGELDRSFLLIEDERLMRLERESKNARNFAIKTNAETKRDALKLEENKFRWEVAHEMTDSIAREQLINKIGRAIS